MDKESQNEAGSAGELLRVLESTVRRLRGEQDALRARRESAEKGFLAAAQEIAPVLAGMKRQEQQIDEAVTSLCESLGKLAQLDEPPRRSRPCGIG